jgi:hypothetical protein
LGHIAEIRPKQNSFDVGAHGERRKPNIGDRKERNLPEIVAICECLLLMAKAAGTETSVKFGHDRNARRPTTRTDGKETLTKFNAPASAVFPIDGTESGATYDALVRERGYSRSSVLPFENRTPLEPAKNGFSAATVIDASDSGKGEEENRAGHASGFISNSSNEDMVWNQYSDDPRLRETIFGHRANAIS